MTTSREKAHQTKRFLKLIPLEDCLRISKEEYDPQVNYADVVASVIEHHS